jgi:hypothetical protein
MERNIPARERNPISGYRLELTCPACGQPMTHATARTDNRGRAANAVAECVCGCQARIDIVLTITRNPLPRAEQRGDRLPIGPWLEYFRDTETAMLVAGWSRDQLVKKKRHGVSEEQAVVLAALVDRQPTTIWPDLCGVSA